jgi:hydroxyethylthiazole kinase-like uncharacterized protein yjeF
MEMIVVTGEQMKCIEKDLFNNRDYRADIAMSLAGYNISEYIKNRYPQSYKIAVVCGHGNNGGDGFAAAFYLNNNFNCLCFFDETLFEKLSEESRYFYKLCKNNDMIQQIPLSITGFDIVIDCILGIGIKGNSNENAKKLISLVNNSNSVIISADIPSGLLPSDIINNFDVVKANSTICMGYPKINTVTYPGKYYAGELNIADIGFPKLPSSDMNFAQIIDMTCTQKFLKRLPPDINKYSKGHLLIIGGFEGMEGAAIISAKAALEGGAGLITIATTKNSRNIISGIIPEAMTLQIDETVLQGDNLEKIISDKKIRSILIGPGLGRTEFAQSIVIKISQLSDAGLIKRLIIDGDALFHISETLWIPSNGETVIMTPHVGEASRLLKICSDDVKNDLFNSSIKLRELYKSNIILKGASTIITGESTWIYPGGCNCLATAGSGDILAGFCAGISLNLLHSPIEAAKFSVFCHGMSVQEYESSIMTSLEIISYIKKFLVKIGYQTVA